MLKCLFAASLQTLLHPLKAILTHFCGTNLIWFSEPLCKERLYEWLSVQDTSCCLTIDLTKLFVNGFNEGGGATGGGGGVGILVTSEYLW